MRIRSRWLTGARARWLGAFHSLEFADTQTFVFGTPGGRVSWSISCSEDDPYGQFWGYTGA